MSNMKGMKGSNDLDASLKDNPGANKDPDMGKSMGTPKPNMTEGFSKGDLHSGSSDSVDIRKDPYGRDGQYYDDRR